MSIVSFEGEFGSPLMLENGRAAVKEIRWVGNRNDLEAWLIRISDYGTITGFRALELSRPVGVGRLLWENQTITLADGSVEQGIGRGRKGPRHRRLKGKPQALSSEAYRKHYDRFRARKRRADASKAKLEKLLLAGDKAGAKRHINRVKSARERATRGEK